MILPQAQHEHFSEGCNNSKSGRGVIFQPRLSREYATKQAEITPSLVGIGVCVMNSKGRYHAHALVASLTGALGRCRKKWVVTYCKKGNIDLFLIIREKRPANPPASKPLEQVTLRPTVANSVHPTKNTHIPNRQQRHRCTTSEPNSNSLIARGPR